MIIGWGLVVWKQNAVLGKLMENYESRYIKFWAIDEILDEQYYDDEVLSGSKVDMMEWALVWYVGAIDDPYTVYLKEEDNAEKTPDYCKHC